MFAFVDEGIVSRIGKELLGFRVVIDVDGFRINKRGRHMDVAAGVEYPRAAIFLLKLAEKIQALDFAVDVIVIIEFRDRDFSQNYSPQRHRVR